MLERVPAPELSATTVADSNVGQLVQNDRKSVSDENWFAEMSQKLFSKPGLQLHLATGVDERSSHRYAAGTVKPPAYVLRTLLRTEHGEAVLNFIMDDSKAAWWSQLQRDRGQAAAARAFVTGMQSL